MHRAPPVRSEHRYIAIGVGAKGYRITMINDPLIRLQEGLHYSGAIVGHIAVGLDVVGRGAKRELAVGIRDLYLSAGGDPANPMRAMPCCSS